MLHQYILLIGFILSLTYTVFTFRRVRTCNHRWSEERLLSVVFGVSLFGLLISAIGVANGVIGGFCGLLVTVQEWLVVVGSLLTCRHINDEHRKNPTGETHVQR